MSLLFFADMSKGTKLSEYEKGQIIALQRVGKSKREIARVIQRSDRVVRNYLSNHSSYGLTKRSGRKKKLSPRCERKIVQAVSNSLKSVSGIRRDLQLDVSQIKILRNLHRGEQIVRAKMQPAPRLTAHHKEVRLLFAPDNMSRDWTKVQ